MFQSPTILQKSLLKATVFQKYLNSPQDYFLENPANPKNDEELKTEKESVAHHKHPHEGVKQKGVSAEPHPMDRKSGTGRG